MSGVGRNLLRSTMVLMSGTGSAQAIGLIAAPLLSRMYTPSDFGALGAFTSMLAILSIFATMRYTQAIVLPKRESDSRQLLALALLSALIFCIAVAAAIAGAGSSRLLKLPQFDDLTRIIWFLPLALLATSVYEAFTYYSLRHRLLGAVARAKIGQSLAQIAVQLAASASGAFGLVGGVASGAAVASASLWRANRSQTPESDPISLRRIAAVAVRYKRFPLFDTWGAALNSAGLNLPPLVLTALLGPTAAGMYVLAHRVLSLPSSLIGRAVADAFLSGAPEAKRRGDLAAQVEVIFALLSGVAMPAIVATAAFGEVAFSVIFGEPWREAGRLASWLSPWIYFVFTTAPLTTLPSILERQGTAAAIQAGLLLSRTAGLFFGATYFNLEVAIASFSFISAAWLLIHASWLMTIAGASRRTTLGRIPRDAVMALGIFGPAIVIREVSTGVPMLVFAVASSVVLMLLYYRAVFRAYRSHTS